MQIIDNFKQEAVSAFNLGWLTSGSQYITGSKVITWGMVTSGVKLFDGQPCKAITFYNHDQPAYRLYRSDNTGDYLAYIKVDSGNASTSVEIKGITDMSQLAYQKHGNSDQNSSGRALLYL